MFTNRGRRIRHSLTDCYSGGLRIETLFLYKTSTSLWATYMRQRYDLTNIQSSRRTASVVWKRMLAAFDTLEDNISHGPNDRVVWCPSTSGDFTLRSAYEVIRPSASRLMSNSYIWNSRLPLKISIFLWKLFRNCCGFPDSLVRFGYHLPSVFPLCYRALASPDHCLLTCHVASKVWAAFTPIFCAPQPQHTVRSQCHSWWLGMPSASALGDLGLLMPILILWNIWKLYTASLYDDVTPRLAQAIWAVRTDVMSITHSRPLARCSPADDILLSSGLIRGFKVSQRMRRMLISWSLPPSGRLKLNVDATFRSYCAGGGGILRDDSSNVLVAFAFPIMDATSPLHAEALALFHSLEKCVAASLFPSIVETDSTLLVSSLSNLATAP